jgi:hypothetical protein
MGAMLNLLFSTPVMESEAKTSSNVTPATSGPLAQPPTPGLPQTPITPLLTPVVPDTPTRTSESPTQPQSSLSSSSPIKRVASPPTNTVGSNSIKSPFRGLRNVASNTMMRVGLGGSSSVPPSPTTKRRSYDNLQQLPRVESPAPRQKQSEDVPCPVDVLDVHTPLSASISTSPMASSNMSAHSKVSSTGLRMARVNAGATDMPTTPLSPVGSVQLADETVHFHDMDFDIVKPKRNRVSVVRTSEDGRNSISRNSHQSDRPPGQPEEEVQIPSPTSPTTVLPSHQTRVSIPAPLVPNSAHNSLTTPASIAAHISREQRWISAMQTIPSSSIRRNKKIKKLLLEGVPASVRGVVW